MKLTLILLALGLSGCSLLPVAYQEVNHELNQTIARSAERVVCEDISIHDWIRLYGQDPLRADAWKTICTPPKAKFPMELPPIPTPDLEWR